MVIRVIVYKNIYVVKFVRSGVDIKYSSDLLSEISQIEKSLKFYVDGAEFSPSFREHRWDGYYRFYTKKTRTFNYGVLHLVISHLNKFKIKYKIENDFLPIQITKKVSTKIWSHLQEAIPVFLKKPYGTIRVPTRGGKTFMAAEIISLTDFASTLFVVDSQLLFEQAVNDISKYLKISRKQIGQIRGDTFDIKPITVAMIQTLQSIKYGLKRLNKSREKKPIALDILKQKRKEKRFKIKSLETFMAGVSLLIVDETHEYGSDDRIATVRLCKNIRAGLFLSATPEKSESPLGNIKIKSIAGPIIYSISPNILKERGVLAKEDILLIAIDHNENKNIVLTDEDNYDKHEQDLIVLNERRNNILINVIQILKHLNIKTLVLFQYIPHGKYIQKILGDELLTGETKMEKRLVVMKSFLKRKAGVLLTTNIFKKGITLPEVEIVFNAGAGKEKTLIIQKKGRALGTTETKKKAMTIDFVDVGDFFSDHSLNRIQAYEEEVGIENISIFDSADLDFYSDVRDFLTEWKNNE